MGDPASERIYIADLPNLFNYVNILLSATRLFSKLVIKIKLMGDNEQMELRN